MQSQYSLEEQATLFLALADEEEGATEKKLPDPPDKLAEYPGTDGTVWESIRGIFSLTGEESNDAWVSDALCAQTDPEAFFPEKGGSTKDAKRICQMCPVRQECLQYAMENDERFGIWGGLSERERRRLRKQNN